MNKLDLGSKYKLVYISGYEMVLFTSDSYKAVKEESDKIADKADIARGTYQILRYNKPLCGFIREGFINYRFVVRDGDKKFLVEEEVKLPETGSLTGDSLVIPSIEELADKVDIEKLVNNIKSKQAFTVSEAISNLDSDSNVLIAVNDKYNPNKVWIVRKYKSGHYSLQQAVATEDKDTASFSKVVRMRKQYITELVGELE